MFFTRVIVLALLFIVLASCTTQKAIKETGKEIDKGNYGVATWYVATLPIAMIYDVFTLGGTADPETGYQTISNVANGSSSSGNLSSSPNLTADSIAPKTSSNAEQCKRSTVSDFTHCCLAIRHGSIEGTHNKDSTTTYTCTGPAPYHDKESCTYSGTMLINSNTACAVQ